MIAILGITKHNFKKDEASLFESVVMETFAPLQRGTLSFKEQVSNFINHYIAIVNTSKENAELVGKVAVLENQIFELSEVQKENERLKQLLQFGKEIPREKVLAQVTGWDSSNEFKVLRINKGQDDGLKVMSPVITINGLVGYVYRLSSNYSDILTILDQNNRVDAIVSRTRSHGIVEGISSFKCRLKHVVRTENIEDGDEVVTAGLGNIYPKGIKIGIVSNVDKENFGMTQEIEITPAVDFHRLEEVVVLIETDDEKTKDYQNPYIEEETK